MDLTRGIVFEHKDVPLSTERLAYSRILAQIKLDRECRRTTIDKLQNSTTLNDAERLRLFEVDAQDYTHCLDLGESKTGHHFVLLPTNPDTHKAISSLSSQACPPDSPTDFWLRELCNLGCFALHRSGDEDAISEDNDQDVIGVDSNDEYIGEYLQYSEGPYWTDDDEEEYWYDKRDWATSSDDDFPDYTASTKIQKTRLRKKASDNKTQQQTSAEDEASKATWTRKTKAVKEEGSVKAKQVRKKLKSVDESVKATTTTGTKSGTVKGKGKEKVARVPKAKKTNIVFAPAEHTASPVTELRPYQQQCIDACLSNLQKGIKRQIVSLPVGSGKTVIFSHLMEKVPPPYPGATKTLVLAHRQELLAQTQAHVLRSGAGLAHHAAAESYRRILHHFGADVPETHIFVYGCSATVRRHDGLKLGGIFDYISFHKDFITMIDDKWLCNLRVSTIKTEFDLKDVKVQRGDFVQKDLAIKCNTPVRNDIVVRSYMTYCKDRKSTVVFAVDIEHAEEMTKVFRGYGFDARVLSSRTPDDERAQLLKDFRARKFPVIVNCGILTEGTDIPAIDSVVMARPTKSNVLFIQMLGRGMRLYPGKEDCHVLDFVDVVQGEGLVSVPTLLGLDPEAVMNTDKIIKNQDDIDAIRNQEIASLEQQLKEDSAEQEDAEVVEAIDAKVARIKVYEYENPYQLIGDCSGAPRRVWLASSNAWVSVGPNEYVLDVRPDAFKIEKSPEDGLYRCQKRVTVEKKVGNDAARSMKASKKSRGRILSKGVWLPIETDTLEDCLRGVDTWISKHIGHKPHLIGRNAKWRKMPASESQMKFLKQLGYYHEPLEDIGGGTGDDEATMSLSEEVAKQQKKRQARKQLTKGQAANMITRLVNGAGKRWEESKKFKIKRAKALAKEIGVEVGPIPKFVEV
ncbi:hypothetical protein BGX28_010278 [Mortierella sp. GBA30]|nr:hypothetical protein BGX28_010278 [Mortierella sp. GBA30]